MLADGYTKLKRWLTRLGILPISLWVILLVVNLTVLILPLGSIFFFRIYENQLIRETETELIAQSVFIAEIFKRELRQTLGDKSESYGLELKKNRPYKKRRRRKKPTSHYTPLAPQLDLAIGPILPPRPDGVVPQIPPDETAAIAGIVLVDMLLEAQRTTLAGIRVLDFNGAVIAGSNETGLSLAHTREVARGLQGHYKSVIRQRISDEPPPSITSISRGTGIRLFTVYPIVSNDRLWGAVYLSRTPRSILKHMFAEKYKVMLAGLFILLATLFIVFITSWTIARPIYRLIERTKNIAAGDRRALEEFRVPGTKEMALLTRSFADTARSLQDRSSYIRNFASHVSHELKTPLTSIRGAAELLDEHFDEMTEKERRRFLGNILDDSDRLKHLVSRLLELAQADSFSPSAEKCDLHVALKEMQRKADGKELTIRLEPQGRFLVKMSAEIVEMILCNLVENARKHGASSVSFKLSQQGEQVRLVLCDDGNGISKANSAKIFDPFFTTRRGQGGTGIGLAIVRSLLENHQGSIALEKSTKGACFTLCFQGCEGLPEAPHLR